MKITIPEDVADQAFSECDDEHVVAAILERIKRVNHVLYVPIKTIVNRDLNCGIILSAVCATIYRMFEIQGNLPTVSAKVTVPIVAEIERNSEVYLTRKLEEIQKDNPHVYNNIVVFAEAASIIRPDLRLKILHTALIFYATLISQIEANNLETEIGHAL